MNDNFYIYLENRENSINLTNLEKNHESDKVANIAFEIIR